MYVIGTHDSSHCIRTLGESERLFSSKSLVSSSVNLQHYFYSEGASFYGLLELILILLDFAGE